MGVSGSEGRWRKNKSLKSGRLLDWGSGTVLQCTEGTSRRHSGRRACRSSHTERPLESRLNCMTALCPSRAATGRRVRPARSTASGSRASPNHSARHRCTMRSRADRQVPRAGLESGPVSAHTRAHLLNPKGTLSAKPGMWSAAWGRFSAPDPGTAGGRRLNHGRLFFCVEPWFRQTPRGVFGETAARGAAQAGQRTMPRRPGQPHSTELAQFRLPPTFGVARARGHATANSRTV